MVTYFITRVTEDLDVALDGAREAGKRVVIRQQGVTQPEAASQLQIHVPREECQRDRQQRRQQ